jgi:hypothetical protein
MVMLALQVWHAHGSIRASNNMMVRLVNRHSGTSGKGAHNSALNKTAPRNDICMWWQLDAICRLITVDATVTFT